MWILQVLLKKRSNYWNFPKTAESIVMEHFFFFLHVLGWFTFNIILTPSSFMYMAIEQEFINFTHSTIKNSKDNDWFRMSAGPCFYCCLCLCMRSSGAGEAAASTCYDLESHSDMNSRVSALFWLCNSYCLLGWFLWRTHSADRKTHISAHTQQPSTFMVIIGKLILETVSSFHLVSSPTE